MSSAAPGDTSTFYIVQRGGQIVAIKRGETSTRTFFAFPNGVINAAGEGGFLSFAFHPGWPATPEVYVSYTTSSASSPANMRSVLARVKSTDGGQTLNDGTREELFTIDQPFVNHDGGNIAFGRDGFLYFGLGDGGPALLIQAAELFAIQLPSARR